MSQPDEPKPPPADQTWLEVENTTPRRPLRLFAEMVKQLPQALQAMLTPRWVVELAETEERCRQHGAAVGLRPEQVDEVMTVVQRYNRRHYFGIPEDVVKERMTAYAMGEEWRP